MEKVKRLLPILLALVLMITSLISVATVSADDTDWRYDESTATLYVFGTGAMSDYADEFSAPWQSIIADVKNVVIENGVTSVGAYAFCGASSLSTVTIADTVSAVGAFAFDSCPMLKSLSFSPSVTSIADSSFATVGATPKEEFVLQVQNGSYAFHYAVENGISFDVDSVGCGVYPVQIKPKAMYAYFKFVPAYDGQYAFSSIGVHSVKGAVYDEDFNALYSSKTSFSTTQTLTAGKTYYVGVSLVSTVLAGSFELNIAAKSFTYKASVVAMADPSGTPTEISLPNALADGNAVGEELTVNVSDTSSTVELSYGKFTKTIEITIDSPNVIAMPACDLNNDGYVNAKDFAIMKKSDSALLPYYQNFINYSVSDFS